MSKAQGQREFPDDASSSSTMPSVLHPKEGCMPTPSQIPQILQEHSYASLFGCLPIIVHAPPFQSDLPIFPELNADDINNSIITIEPTPPQLPSASTQQTTSLNRSVQSSSSSPILNSQRITHIHRAPTLIDHDLMSEVALNFNSSSNNGRQVLLEHSYSFPVAPKRFVPQSQALQPQHICSPTILTNSPQPSSHVRNVRTNVANQNQVTPRSRTRQRKQTFVVRQDYSETVEIPTHTSQVPATNTNESSITESFLGTMDLRCRFCSALHFAQERTKKDKIHTTCCSKGEVQLPEIKTNPLIQDLMMGNHIHSSNFLSNIRSYNNAFAFASVGAQVRFPPGVGPYCFRVSGEIRHRIGPLHPSSNDNPKYSQLYILDSEAATTFRTNEPSNSQCKKDLFDELLAVLTSVNPFVSAHKMMHEVETEMLRNAPNANKAVPNLQMAILQDRKSDPRRYNVQQCNEVAIVFTSQDGEPPFSRDLLIHLRCPNPSFKTQKISILHKNLEALTYPLLFPFGEQGWSEDLALVGAPFRKKKKKITLKMYYAYMLSDRGVFSAFLNGGKLTQQYVVDGYVKAESNDLTYIKTHQADLRAEKYSTLIQNQNSLEEEQTSPGRRIILPSSFPGSPRNMKERFRDSMTIVAKFGKPTLFATMTCNPSWKEIQDNLKGQRPENRPDIVARVFNLKLKELLNDVLQKKIFGTVLAYVYVIEFQKRGLPHAHILITLDNAHRPSTPAEVDSIISAEIPDPRSHPILFSIVTKHMLHGPCGETNPTAVCMSIKNSSTKQECSRKFPKSFNPTTNVVPDGYPMYRRRQHPPVTLANGRNVDHSWVVPYNPFLLLKYNCHLNVEICASIKSVKYLHKYIHKGHDCANVRLKFDEIEDYLNARYVSPPEAMWRIFKFIMADQSHSITRLSVHLPEEQTVIFQPHTIQQSLQNAEQRPTTLTAWFRLNQRDPMARLHKYVEIPEHYSFSSNSWVRRTRFNSKTIGRIHAISLKDSELYFLRLLLLHIPGAKSYEDLRTVQGHLYDSYFQAAKRMGLVQDESVWSDTISEAALSAMPKQLRELLAYICLFCDIADASRLWIDHKDHFIEDFVHTHQSHDDSCQLCESLALLHIESILNQHSKHLSDFQLPLPDRRVQHTQDVENVLFERRQAETLIPTLNTEQAIAFRRILSALQTDQPHDNLFYLDGRGGTGKTYLYGVLTSYAIGNGIKVIVTASTGIAANLLNKGRTAHSTFAIPLSIDETSTSSMTIPSKQSRLLKEARLIIWDEASMIHMHSLGCVDRLLQQIMNNNLPFGGKVIVLGGDFRQTLPIIPHVYDVAILESTIKSYPTWGKFIKLHLQTNVRSIDPTYSQWLVKLGDGELTNVEGLNPNLIKIPTNMLSNGDLVTEVFGSSLDPNTIDNFADSAILCPTNEDAAEINAKVLDILQGQSMSYYSMDSIQADNNDSENDYPVEFLNTLDFSGFPTHKLTLKVGAIVMLLRNLNTNVGLCNGTRLVITEMRTNVLIARVLSGSGKGNMVFLPRIKLKCDNQLPFTFIRRQFPIRLAFAMTINKSQGQTLRKVGIYLPKPVFAHGQLYVAFSRSKSASDVKILICNSIEQGKLLDQSDSVFTINIVYKEILN